MNLPPNIAALRPTDEDLTDDGRYFCDSFEDLTKCSHGETGEFQHSDDGTLIEFLWNGWRAGTIVLADPKS